MFKVSNKTPERELIDVVLVFLLLTLNNFTTFSKVSIVDFEQVNAGWEGINQSTQPTIICSKLTIETREEGVKYVQS